MFDYGIDFYSPQSFVDSRGRRIMTGWMSRMDAGQEESCPTRAHGYIHCLSLPRVLTWEDGALRQRPVPELLSLRRFLRTGTALSGSLNAESGHFELVLKRSDPFSPLDLTLRSGTVGIHYDPQSSRFVVTRKNWADGGTQFREIRLGSLTDLDIFSGLPFWG